MADGSGAQGEIESQRQHQSDNPAAAGPAAAPPVRSSSSSSGPSRWPRTFASFESRDFRFFWFGLVVMMGGLQMQMLARAYLVYDLTDSASLLGVVSVASAAPILVLSLFGGVAADRFERRRVLQAGQAVSAVLAGFIAVANTTGFIEWYHLLVVATIQGAMWAFMMPARQSMIPELVSREHITNAVSLSSAAMSTTTLLAPAIGGVIYAKAGPAAVYYSIAAMSLLSMVLTAQVPQTRGSGAGKKGAVLADIAEGLKHCVANKMVLALLVMGLATTLLAMPFRFMLPVFIVDVYGRGPDSMGIMLSLFGLGALTGSLFIASIGHWRRGMLLITTSFLSAVALGAIAALPFFFVAVAIMALLGLGDSGRRSLNQALIMEEVEERYRGRVMSVYMMNFGLMPLGMLPAGLVADWLGGQVAIGILAFLLFGVTLAVMVSQSRLRALQ
jgi:MFS family permease